MQGNPKSQVWVTSALSNEEVEKSLILCYSLRRTFTTRRIAVIVSSSVSVRLRQTLKHGFDMVYYLEEDQNEACLATEDFAKLFSLNALSAYDECVYLAPTMMVLKNCDDIFDKNFTAFCFSKDSEDSSMFMFQPSLFRYEAILYWLKSLNSIDASIGVYLRRWASNQFEGLGFLPEMYNQLGEDSFELSVYKKSIVNLENKSAKSDIIKMEADGIFGKVVATYWRKIYHDNVLPLMNRSTLQLPPQSGNIALRSAKNEPIAIIGMSCRYPGANNLEEFWKILVDGQDATSNPPNFRWLSKQCYKPLPNAVNTNAGFLNQPVDEMDSGFFGVSPKEGLFLDPQHRLILEVVWESLEDAFVDPQSLHGTRGSVFLGSWLNDYKDILTNSGNEEFYRVYMGNSSGAAAARISFLLGLTGPSIATESGCSSAMVGVHLACKALQSRESNLALACGVNMLLRPFDKDALPMVVSPDGRCKTFSEDANGFARAEGAGVLVLKRFSDAMRDGNRIWGVIRGSSVVQEGLSASLGTPTVECEAMAMKEALRNAAVLPEQVSYVEAHGTGTIVGDPLEVAAIAKAYNSSKRKEPLLIGSVKTNVGHTESCSGITSIMKVILAMQHEVIPAHINFTNVNPLIDLNAVPAVIPMKNMEWKSPNGEPRIAGVSSFGIAGTDTHVILQSHLMPDDIPPLTMNSEMERPLNILTISAKTEEAMKALLDKYDNYLKSSENSVADIAFSANTGRANFPIRAAIIGNRKSDLCKAIHTGTYLSGKEKAEQSPKICFLFTGQGSQYPKMAKCLHETSPVFRMHFDYCAKLLKTNYDIKILEALSSDEIHKTLYSQTSIFCIEYALFKLWESWGVQPNYVLGHSLGEFAAAVCAGVITVEDAIKLVAERSLLIDNLPSGKMLVVKTEYLQLIKLLNDFAGEDKSKVLDIAAVNSTDQSVVAGGSEVIDSFASFCTKQNIKCVVLSSSHAFHSSHMNSILESYKRVADTVIIQESPSCEYISGVTGSIISYKQLNSEYWIKHTRNKVSFLNASAAAIELGCKFFIEIGPQPVLTTLMSTDNTDKVLLPSIKRNQPEWATILDSLGKLYVNGIKVNWEGFDIFCNRKKVRVPHYPFIRKKLWPDMVQTTEKLIHPLLGSSIPNATSTKLFQGSVSLSRHEWIKDHTVGQNVIFPGAGYLEMCLAAGFVSTYGFSDAFSRPSQPMKVENLIISAPLPLQSSESKQVQTIVKFNKDIDISKSHRNDVRIKIYQRVITECSSSWMKHAEANFSPSITVKDLDLFIPDISLSEVISKECELDVVVQLYKQLDSLGLKLGPVFQSIKCLWRVSGDKIPSIISKLRVPLEDMQYNDYLIHPIVLDAMLQAVIMLKLIGKLNKKLYVPVKIGKLIWLSDISKEDLYIHAFEDNSGNACDKDAFTTNCSAVLLNSTGKRVAVISSIEFIDTTVPTFTAVLEQQRNPMPDLWQETWSSSTESSQNSVDLHLCEAALHTMNGFYFDCHFDQIYNTCSDTMKTLRKIDHAIYLNMLKGLYDCGWKPSLNEVFDEQDFFADLKVGKQFWKQLQYFLKVFETENNLKRVHCSENNRLWKVINLPPNNVQILQTLSDQNFNSELVSSFKSFLLLEKVGNYLGCILQGSQSTLSILFPEERSKSYEPSAEEFYKDYPKLIRFTPMATQIKTKWLEEYLRLSSSKGEKSRFRVIELGAGTGGYTQIFLDILQDLQIDYEYTYTDISSAFFPNAEKRFADKLKYIKFKKLNVEEDPISQGFAPGYYDLICASDVIHATRNLKATLSNVNALLKPNGIFELVEQTKVSRIITYLFGLLDGFWRFTDFETRPDHCTLSKEGWEAVLNDSGLKYFGGYSSAEDHHSVMFSIKTSTPDKPISIMSQKKYWILFHDDASGLSNFVKEKIEELAAGRDTVVLICGTEFRKFADNKYSIRPNSELDYVHLLTSITKDVEGKIEGIIYCWSLNEKNFKQEEILLPYFLLVKSISTLKQTESPKICVLTKNSIPITENVVSNFATIWGFNKSLSNENVHVQVKCVDVGDESSENEMLEVFYEIWKAEKTNQIAFRHGSRFIPKLCQHKPFLKALSLPPGANRFQLILPETKSISDLQFEPAQSMLLGNDEVEVEIKFAALNFRDVLNVLKPSDYFKGCNGVGFDVSGVVTRAHANVTKWHVGDNVFGLNWTGIPLPSHFKVHKDGIIPVPDHMTLAEASTLPVVVITSYHCLVEVAKLKSTDTVLIHTASGGVGLSAIQICKHVGATIIATAGSKRKQNYLKSLGIEHIFHSRSSNYSDEILKVTNGRGVDVVLNSLTSAGFKEATLKACAKGARFVEMSQLSIWEPEEINKLRPDIQYTIIDLTKFKKDKWHQLLLKLKDLVADKVVGPIPYVRFDALHIREALQYIQKAKHVGKIVCTMPEITQVNGRTQIITPMFNSRSTYLITGGLGGIGFEVCKWMVSMGAKYVVLAGRTGPNTNQLKQIESLNSENNSNVTAVQLDIASLDQCRHLIFTQIPKLGFPSLRGIMHSAGTLNDALIGNHTWESLSSTFGPKVTGTQNLHELTKDCNLEHFVMFSSMAALFGSPGQSNHSAANNFQDSFGHYRHSLGLPALSVNWGQWGQVGVASEMELPGVRPLTTLQGIAGLEYAMKSHRTQFGVINFESLVTASKLFPIISSYMDERVWKSSKPSSTAHAVLTPEAFWQQYDSADKEESRVQMLMEKLKLILRNILNLDESDMIDDHCNFQEMGLDSLMFVELKNALQFLLGERITVHANVMRDCNTVYFLATKLHVLIGQKERLDVEPTSLVKD